MPCQSYVTANFLRLKYFSNSVPHKWINLHTEVPLEAYSYSGKGNLLIDQSIVVCHTLNVLFFRPIKQMRCSISRSASISYSKICTYHTDFRNTVETGNGEVESHIKGVTCKAKERHHYCTFRIYIFNLSTIDC